EGTRSNLWGAMRTAIETIRPQYAVIENVRGLLSPTAPGDSDLEQRQGFMGDEPNVTLRAIDRVLGDLADNGYDAQWHGVRAPDLGAPHGRYRIFSLAGNAGSAGLQGEERGSQRRNVRERPELGGRRDQAIAHTESRRRRDAHPIDQRQTSGKVNTPRNDSHATSRAPGPSTQWGDYEPAIRRWEQRVRRMTPTPSAPTP